MLAAVSGALAYVVASEFARARAVRRAAPPRLVELLGDPQCAVGVGQVYLRAHADEAHLDLLSDLILPGVDVARTPLAALRVAFRQRVQADLDADELVDVDGWLFARTEARLFAMDALWKAEQTS
jgi:hypothetical protein